MKKETLEEAIKYYAHNYFDMHENNNFKALEKGFEAGAKWQQERSYSKEDMISFGRFMFYYGSNEFKEYEDIFNEWLEK